MVKLQDTRKNPKSGLAYYRIFGNKEFSWLLSRVQGLVIKSGYDLEDLILKRVKKIDDLDVYLKKEEKEYGVFAVPKKVIKKSKRISFDGIEPDFMIFVEKKENKECHIVELKDGCHHDTKSANAENESLKKFIQNNASKLQYTVDGHLCCFNEDSREAIVTGFKNKISLEVALTGREFCKLLEIDYDEILQERMADRENNMTFFLVTLLENNIISKKLKELLSKE